MADLQGKDTSSGDGGNRTREPFPPLRELPAVPESALFAGVSAEQWLYRFHDADGVLLYVGVTQCGEERFTEHRKSKAWWPDVASVTVQTYSSRAEVLAAERNAIYREKPVHNVAHNSTGRRLFGEEPIPLSEPLTREAMESRALGRMLDALYGPITDNVVHMADRRRRRLRPVA